MSARRAAYLTAAAGMAHAVLFLASYWLIAGRLDPQASDADLVALSSEHDLRLIVVAGLYLMPFAGIAFVWFIVALRMWIVASGAPENILLSNVQLVSGILYVALLFASAAAAAASAASVELSSAPVDLATARQMPSLSNVLMFVFAMRMGAMFVFTTSNIGNKAHVLPRWFVVVGFLVGVFLLLSATFSPLLILVFPVWLLTLSFFLLLRARHVPADALLPVGAIRVRASQDGDGG